MLKFATQGVAPRLIVGLVSSAQSSCQLVAPALSAATQKFISQSSCYDRKVDVKDHYEFDQKVGAEYLSFK